MICHFFIMALLCISCSENFSGGSRNQPPPQEEVQIAPPPADFLTRLSSTLLIEGKKCRGDETTEAYGNGFHCDPGQYLIYIDNVNACDSEGRCSDVVIIPIVGELQNIQAGLEGSSIFEIIPKSLVTGAQSDILKQVALSTDVNGNGTVFLKEIGPN